MNLYTITCTQSQGGELVDYNVPVLAETPRDAVDLLIAGMKEATGTEFAKELGAVRNFDVFLLVEDVDGDEGVTTGVQVAGYTLDDVLIADH